MLSSRVAVTTCATTGEIWSVHLGQFPKRRGSAGLHRRLRCQLPGLLAKYGSAHFDEGNGNAFEAPGNSQDLSFSTLGAGETATGTLVFDMPAPHGRIAYAPNLNGQALGYWRY
jgi:hypothetical protein